MFSVFHGLLCLIKRLPSIILICIVKTTIIIVAVLDITNNCLFVIIILMVINYAVSQRHTFTSPHVAKLNAK